MSFIVFFFSLKLTQMSRYIWWCRCVYTIDDDVMFVCYYWVSIYRREKKTLFFFLPNWKERGKKEWNYKFSIHWFDFLLFFFCTIKKDFFIFKSLKFSKKKIKKIKIWSLFIYLNKNWEKFLLLLLFFYIFLWIIIIKNNQKFIRKIRRKKKFLSFVSCVNSQI